MNATLYLALAWLGLLVLAANAGNPAPEGLGLIIFGLTFASIVYLYVRLCRRWPICLLARFWFSRRPVWLVAPRLCPHRSHRRRRGQRDQRQRQLRRCYRRHLFRRWRRLVGMAGRLRCNDLVLKKLFALTQGKPPPSTSSPSRKHTMSNVPTVIPRKLKLPAGCACAVARGPRNLFKFNNYAQARD